MGTDRLNLGSGGTSPDTDDLDPRIRAIISNTQKPEEAAKASMVLQLGLLCNIENAIVNLERNMNVFAQYIVARGRQEKIFAVDEHADIFDDDGGDDDGED